MFDITTLDEKATTWLIKFRRSKSMETLDIMVEAAERDNQGMYSELDAINLAWCARELEIKAGKFV